MLEVNDVHTYYGNIHALKGISLTVEKGEIVTLIGSNGAGKTTTLRSICGLQKPRQGNITLEAREPARTKQTSALSIPPASSIGSRIYTPFGSSSVRRSV